MTELNVYAWLLAPFGLILGVIWRVFLSGDTLKSVNRKMEALKVKTSSKTWDTVGGFLPRHNNRAIMRLCILQMQLLIFAWWFCLLLTIICTSCLLYILIDPNFVIDPINNYVPGDGLNLSISIPILLFWIFIVMTIFVAAYRRRLLDLVGEMS